MALGCGASTETDAPRSDAGPNHDGTPAIVGTWHTCRERLVIQADGKWSTQRSFPDCTSSGGWVQTGRLVSLTLADSDCADPPVVVQDAEVVRTATRLVLFHPSYGSGAQSWISDSEPRAVYALSGQGPEPPANGSSRVRLVGDRAKGPISACHWSTDGECGGLLSCSGSVEQWQLQEGALVAKLGCTGGCPCAAILQGTEDAQGRIDGTLLGADCNSTITGTFVALPQSDLP